jgi:negative regulator of replication initiation
MGIPRLIEHDLADWQDTGTDQSDCLRRMLMVSSDTEPNPAQFASKRIELRELEITKIPF